MFHTMSNLYNPLRQLREFQRDVDRLLGRYAPASTRAGGFPPVNVYASNDGAVVTAELPGIDPESLDITAQASTLTVRGERTLETAGDESRTWHRQERAGGAFSRTFQLPFDVDSDKVSASYRNGVLTIRLERPESHKPRKIAVKTG